MKENATSSPSPTDAELEILRILWERGASTVREVHTAIGERKSIGYTTVLKQMQVMRQKGLLARSDRFRSHVYQPAQSQTLMQRRLASSILHQVFDGSARQLLQSALAGRKVDAAELDEIRRVLDQYERKMR